MHGLGSCAAALHTADVHGAQAAAAAAAAAVSTKGAHMAQPVQQAAACSAALLAAAITPLTRQGLQCPQLLPCEHMHGYGRQQHRVLLTPVSHTSALSGPLLTQP
jgi:hypothetical protein